MKESVRICRFAIIGTLNAIITAIVVGIMMHLCKQDYILANIVAYIIAQIHNFIWCKYWVFPLVEDDKKNTIWHQMMYFAGAFAVAYLAQFCFLLVLVEILNVNEYLAQFLGLFIYGSINFLFNRNITFR
ncbi:GtrA family protein [uncultured Bacteroides sp.]|uniref:GtrA family protein n=1 Tax=uncultured Bacteroides sp. TaxID=162156 RepID=UPI00260BB725|nr:GtrA family protein [uncultured Bacteroides sp.]